MRRFEYAKPGDVLIVATNAYEEASVAGDVMLGMAKNQGVCALVTDGMVRDVDGLNAVGIPVFARGFRRTLRSRTARARSAYRFRSAA